VRVAACREEEHRPAERSVQLVLSEREVCARDPGDHCERVVSARGRLDLLQPAPGQDDAAGRSTVSVTASPA
jgi:hypothetical protein